LRPKVLASLPIPPPNLPEDLLKVYGDGQGIYLRQGFAGEEYC
jgi:hypothetical protein